MSVEVANATRVGVGEALPGKCLVIERSEWQHAVELGVGLTEEDRSILHSLDQVGERKLVVEELREGLRVRATSWVGIVRLATIEIRVAPKLPGDHIALARMIQLCCGVDGLRLLPQSTTFDPASESLLELIALLFADEAWRVVRRGLARHYVEREEVLGQVRGRILTDRQVLKRFGRLDRIHCRFDDLEGDVDENRLLLAGAVAATRHVRSVTLRRSLERLRSVLMLTCDVSEFDPRGVRKELVYDRLNAHYEAAHGLSYLLLDGLGLDDLLFQGTTRGTSFLIDMNALFERFVEVVFRRALEGRRVSVEAQLPMRSVLWDVGKNAPYGTVRPDLVIRRDDGRVLAVDAKYKTYDVHDVSSADLYQLMIYALATCRPRAGEEPSLPKALLVYPASAAQSVNVVVEARSLGGSAEARVRTLALSIPEVLRELEFGAGETLESIGRLVQA